MSKKFFKEFIMEVLMEKAMIDEEGREFGYHTIRISLRGCTMIATQTWKALDKGKRYYLNRYDWVILKDEVDVVGTGHSMGGFEGKLTNSLVKKQLKAYLNRYSYYG